MKYDVHVVGAGVSGSIAALELSKKGMNVVVTEEDSKIGLPRHCTGVISVRGLEASGLDYKKAILNTLRGAVIFGPYGNKWTVERKEVQAYVVDRRRLDEIYAEAAVKSGVELIMHNRVSSRKDYLANIIVGADGANSTVASIEGFPKISYLKGYQQIIESKNIVNDHFVRIFLSQRLFPGFFGWYVPLEDGRAIVGFGVKGKFLMGRSISYLLKTMGMEEYKVIERFGGLIPMGPRKATQKGNVILIGDAGGYAKATSGGGVYFSTLSAKIAAECIANGRINDYDRMMSDIKRELWVHSQIRNVYNISNDIFIGILLKFGKLIGIPKYIENKGDMDYATTLFRI